MDENTRLGAIKQEFQEFKNIIQVYQGLKVRHIEEV